MQWREWKYIKMANMIVILNKQNRDQMECVHNIVIINNKFLYFNAFYGHFR
jgi:hypothetical protein